MNPQQEVPDRKTILTQFERHFCNGSIPHRVCKRGAEFAFQPAGAIDLGTLFVVLYSVFEGEKSFESPVRPNGLRVAVPYKDAFWMSKSVRPKLSS